MTHSTTRPLFLRERAATGLLVLLERIALASLRHGPFKRRVLARVDRDLQRLHSETLGEG
jgi:hypothetical protein